MSTQEQLIPDPPLVRERIAWHVKESRLLRSLLRLSIRASEVRDRQYKHEQLPGEAREAKP